MTDLTPLSLPGLSALSGIKHGFFTRQGGVSTGIYDSLNCGVGSEDEPDHVHENRSRVGHWFGTNTSLATVYQVHGVDVATVQSPLSPDQRPEADALVTNQPGIALGILTADCGPLLFADPDAKVIGAAHAGWGGALNGVMDETITAMEALGANRKNITVGIGPCITALSYEVGPEFYDRFISANSLYGVYFHPARRSGYFRFDLPNFLEMRVRRAGVHKIERLELCTYLDEERFFSNRRRNHLNEADYGRQISAIMLEE